MPDASDHTANTRGYLVALVATAFLSTTSIIIRFLTQTYHMPALVLAFWRAFLVALVMAVALLVMKRSLLGIGWRHIRYFILYGLVLAVFNSLWTLSVSINGAGIATVLAYSSTAFTALLGWWLLKEQLDWVKGVAVALALIGCVLVSGALDPAAWVSNLLGIVTGVLTGLGYAAYTLMGRSAAQRGVNPWTTLMYAFGCASIFLLLFSLLGGGLLPGAASRPADLLWLRDSALGWGMLFLLAAGPTVIGFGLYNVSLSLLPASVANLIATLEPAFTVVTAYFLFHETLSPIQIAGSLMIVAGVVFMRVNEGRLTSRMAAVLE